ncbi:hypothetical protein D3C79_832040 [compost metagenome]
MSNGTIASLRPFSPTRTIDSFPIIPPFANPATLLTLFHVALTPSVTDENDGNFMSPNTSATLLGIAFIASHIFVGNSLNGFTIAVITFGIFLGIPSSTSLNLSGMLVIAVFILPGKFLKKVSPLSNAVFTGPGN